MLLPVRRETAKSAKRLQSATRRRSDDRAADEDVGTRGQRNSAAKRESPQPADQDETELERDAQVAQVGSATMTCAVACRKRCNASRAPESGQCPAGRRPRVSRSQPGWVSWRIRRTSGIDRQHNIERPEQQMNAPQQSAQQRQTAPRPTSGPNPASGSGTTGWPRPDRCPARRDGRRLPDR